MYWTHRVLMLDPGQDTGAGAVGKTDSDPSSNVGVPTGPLICSLWPTQCCKCSVFFFPLETLGNLAPWNCISTWRQCQGSEGVVLRNTYHGEHRLTYHLPRPPSLIAFNVLAFGGHFGCDPPLYVPPFTVVTLWTWGALGESQDRKPGWDGKCGSQRVLSTSGQCS